MSRQVARIDGNTYISVSKKCFAKLVLNDRALSHLYLSPKHTAIPIIRFYYIAEDEFENFESAEDVLSFLTRYENECFYYTGHGVDYWVDTGIYLYDEYVEIYHDYPSSKLQYTTLVKRYCKWAK